MWKALMRRQLWTVDSHGVRGLVRSLRLGEEVKGENGAGKEPVVEVAKSVEKDLVESVSEKVEDLAESVSEGVAEGGFTGGLKALTEETRDLVQEELKAVAEDLVKQAEENVKTAGENIEAVGTLVKAVGEEFSSVGKKIQAFEEKVAEATEEVETIMGEDTPPELTATDNIEDWKRAERQVEKALSRRNDSIAPKRQPKPPSGQFMGQWVLVENLNTYASRDDLRELFKSSRLAPSDCIQKGNPLESLVTQWFVRFPNTSKAHTAMEEASNQKVGSRKVRMRLAQEVEVETERKKYAYIERNMMGRSVLVTTMPTKLRNRSLDLFLSEYNPKDVRVNSAVPGTAVAVFRTEEEARRAARELHREYIFDSRVEVRVI